MSDRSNRVATIARTHFQWAAAAAASLWLAGCSGGGGSYAANDRTLQRGAEVLKRLAKR